MNFFFKMKENRFFISLGDCFCRLLSPWTPLAVLLIIAMYVMFGEDKYISELLGVSNKEAPKNEVLKIIGILMGGILVVWQAWASHKRAKAMEGTAESQVRATKEQARANENTEQGLRQERLKNAIEHLGHEKDSVRLGGAYELFHLAKDAKEDVKELRQTALDILCAHIRWTTGEKEYREAYKTKPSEEVQSLLILLFVQNYEVFKGLQISLQGSWLKGANLQGARLEKAILTEAHLQVANFREARLQGANLSSAYLQGANLFEAKLQEATLGEASLQGANLNSAYLQGADLIQASLQGANLGSAYLQGANLGSAYLQGANLPNASLQGANLFCVQLQGAVLGKASLQGANLAGAHLGGIHGIESRTFMDNINKYIDQPFHPLSVIFEGGLTEKDVDSFVEGLSKKKANKLRESLQDHIKEEKSYELSDERGAIITPYNEKKAKKWIKDYENAMSEVPEDDS